MALAADGVVRVTKHVDVHVLYRSEGVNLYDAGLCTDPCIFRLPKYDPQSPEDVGVSHPLNKSTSIGID